MTDEAQQNSDTTTPKKRRRRGQRLEEAQRKAAQALFLDAFRQTANVTGACQHAGIDRSTMYRWQEHDEDFSLRYQQAEAEANDVVRGEIFRRAVIGVNKPLTFQGQIARDADGVPVTVKEYSDTLLIFLAKARMPEFRDKLQLEQSGQVLVNHDFGDDPTTAALARNLLGRLSNGTRDASGSGLSGE